MLKTGGRDGTGGEGEEVATEREPDIQLAEERQQQPGEGSGEGAATPQEQAVGVGKHAAAARRKGEGGSYEVRWGPPQLHSSRCLHIASASRGEKKMYNPQHQQAPPAYSSSSASPSVPRLSEVYIISDLSPSSFHAKCPRFTSLVLMELPCLTTPKSLLKH